MSRRSVCRWCTKPPVVLWYYCSVEEEEEEEQEEQEEQEQEEEALTSASIVSVINFQHASGKVKLSGIRQSCTCGFETWDSDSSRVVSIKLLYETRNSTQVTHTSWLGFDLESTLWLGRVKAESAESKLASRMCVR
jgi:hypothetical protein